MEVSKLLDVLLIFISVIIIFWKADKIMKKYELRQKIYRVVTATQFNGNIKKLESFLQRYGISFEECFKIVGIDEEGNYIISCNTLHGEEIINDHYIVFDGTKIIIFTKKAFEFFYKEKNRFCEVAK